MENIITIDGVEYVKKGLMNTGIFCCGRISKLDFINDSDKNVDNKTITQNGLLFKFTCEMEDCQVSMQFNKHKSKNIQTPHALIGYEFYEIACKCINALNYDKFKQLNFSVYSRWDDKKNEFIKDQPVLLVWGDYSYMIAPRIKD